jgi:hypothetical protein
VFLGPFLSCRSNQFSALHPTFCFSGELVVAATRLSSGIHLSAPPQFARSEQLDRWAFQHPGTIINRTSSDCQCWPHIHPPLQDCWAPPSYIPDNLKPLETDGLASRFFSLHPLQSVTASHSIGNSVGRLLELRLLSRYFLQTSSLTHPQRPSLLPKRQLRATPIPPRCAGINSPRNQSRRCSRTI